MKTIAKYFVLCAALVWGASAMAQSDYLLGPGDVIRISVFQNPDLTTETRVSETGQVSFPLLGAAKVGGMSVSDAERTIARGLRDGGYVLEPQVTILPLEIRGNQVTVLGQVNKPGRYPLETFDMRVSDALALAGGIAPDGADVVVLTGARQGDSVRREIPLTELFARNPETNVALSGGDIIFVDRAPTFYIYGQVQKPGAYRLEHGMTLMQALATGGGLTNRGTERGMRVHRRDMVGNVEVLALDRNAPLQPNDVIYVKESLF